MPQQPLFDYIFSDIAPPKTAAVLDVGCRNMATLLDIKNRFGVTGTLIGIDNKTKISRTKTHRIKLESNSLK